jgi:uncharacterized delta-60 repeat protein
MDNFLRLLATLRGFALTRHVARSAANGVAPEAKKGALAAFLTLCVCASPALLAAPVLPDPSFGIAGVAHVGAGPSDEIADAAAVQPDGKLVIAGRCDRALCLVRLNTNGTPDTAFNASGRVVVAEAPSTYSRFSVMIQPDGKVVVAGACGAGFCVARRNADGSPDISFNGSGFAAIAAPEGYSAVSVAALQSNGRIVVLGNCGPNAKFCAVRFTDTGAVDTSFGGAGTGMIVEPGYMGAIGAVTLSDDRIVALTGCDTSSVCFRRLLANGQPDTTFGAAGVVALPMGRSQFDEVERGMTLLPDGKFVLAANCVDIGACVARFNADGSPDTTFGGTGYAAGGAQGIAVHADGKVSLVRLCLDGQNYFACVVRYAADGSVDSAFNAGSQMQTALRNYPGALMFAAALPGGKLAVITNCPSTVAPSFDTDRRDFCAERLQDDGTRDASFNGTGTANPIYVRRSGGWSESALLQPDGKLLIAGFCDSMSPPPYYVNMSDTCIARMNSNGTADTAFNGLGAVQIDLGGEDSGRALLLQPGGKIVVASGCYFVGEGPRLCLARLNADGSLDVTFGTQGRVVVLAGATTNTSMAVFGMVAQSDGRFVVGGNCFVDSASYACAHRFDANGGIDTTFNGTGQAMPAISSGAAYSRIALQPDEKILLASTCGGDFCAFRLNGDGSLDTAFGSGGKVLTSLTTGNDNVFGAQVLADGKIVLGGTCNDSVMCFARFLPGGTLDTTFGLDGTVLGLSGRVSAITIAPAGKLLVAGVCAGQNCVVRIREDGSLDASFNDANQLTVPFEARGVFLLPDGKIVLGGGTSGFDGMRLLSEPDTGTQQAVQSDFNGDGRSDVLWHNSATGMLYELQMNGLATGVAGVIDQETDLNWKVVAVADLNNDVRADVVWQNDATGQVYGLLMNGTTVAGEGTIYTEPNTQWKILGAGDFDGDGRADLLWKNSATGDVFLLLMNGLTVTGGGVIYSEPNANWQIQKVADFDGDGRADVLWRNVATGDVFVLLMNGTTVAGGGVIYSEPNTAWQIQTAADFNGDGRADVLWRNTATGDVFMMLMNGTTITGGSVFYGEPNADWKIVASGDYNGDNRADILWRNTATGQVFMMLMDGFTISGGGFVYTETDQNWKILGP